MNHVLPERRSSDVGCAYKFEKQRETRMRRPLGIEIVRRAYELWEQAGKPDGRDQEFYHQAERELQEALDKETAGKETPDD
jgi:Protein of unknown function (DUF2934)